MFHCIFYFFYSVSDNKHTCIISKDNDSQAFWLWLFKWQQWVCFHFHLWRVVKLGLTWIIRGVLEAYSNSMLHKRHKSEQNAEENKWFLTISQEKTCHNRQVWEPLCNSSTAVSDILNRLCCSLWWWIEVQVHDVIKVTATNLDWNSQHSCTFGSLQLHLC